MPKTEINYSNAVIYKICCLDVDVSNIYIGSTTNFTKRKYQHKYNSNSNGDKDKQCNMYVYQFIRDNGGWDNWNMIEIEKCNNVNDVNELKARERYYIESLKSKLNKSIPLQTYSEYNEKHKESHKEYYETHKGAIKEYRENHKEIIKLQKKTSYETHKEYYKERNKKNKDAILLRCKKYYEANKIKKSTNEV